MAYQPGPGDKLGRVLAVAILSKENFYFSGEAVLYLKNQDDYYYFEAPLYGGKSPKGRQARQGVDDY